MSVNKAELVQRLTRGLGITEPEAIALFAGLTPTVLVDDLTDDFSSDVFQARKASMSGIKAGVIAESGHVHFTNPVGSGVNCIVTLIEAFLETTGSVVLSRLAGVTAGLGGQFRDLRRAGNSPGNVAGTGTAGALGTEVAEGRVLANVVYRFDQTWLVPPNNQLIITALSTDVDIRGNFYWTDIPHSADG